MAEKDEKKEIQPHDAAFEVTELDDESLEDVSGGELVLDGSGTPTNENCHGC
jgi:hypothetical protein